MRLIFIRHAEPDYKNNTLTAKGFREAAILAKRTAAWSNVRGIFVSPLARAQLTAAPCLEAMGRTAVTCDWLQEFLYDVKDPETGRDVLFWDLAASFFTEIPAFYTTDGWLDTPFIRSNPAIAPAYRTVCRELDALLARNGYVRENNLYRAGGTDGDEEDCLIFFCHFGITSVLLSHLTGISPILLLHHTVIPPTGVTVLNAEKDAAHAAHFRAQVLGDVSHLQRAGEPTSAMAAFTPLFQG